MLVELRIRNIAVIDAVTLAFQPALNVLTGETGAGKSLIVGALGLLLGDRAAGDRLRAGAERGSVEGVFDIGARTGARAAIWELLESRGLEGNDGTIVLKRELAVGGRSRAWINGTPVTAAVLSDVGARLVTVHGQHESQELLAPEAQRDVLDRYAGAHEIARQVTALSAQIRALEVRRDARDTERKAAEKRVDYLRFVVNEIGSAAPVDGEDDDIEVVVRKLANANEIMSLAQEISQVLDGDDPAVMSQLRGARRAMNALMRLDPGATELQAALDSSTEALLQLSRDLVSYFDSVQSNPRELERVEARRELLHNLKRKYGPTLRDVQTTLETTKAELALVDGGAFDMAEIAREIAAVQRELESAAKELSILRKAGAARLSRAVSELLPELGMPDGTFTVDLTPLAERGAHGNEDVAFQVALNVGTERRPLARIASGGELARVMLALSTVLARLQEVPTLVFDEVDAGVGGTVAWQVGALMRRVATHHQVLAISHLAQIAARAHQHLVVRKGAVGGVTTSDTEIVSDEARVLEIARMLGGDAEREVSRAHARELIDRGAEEVAALPDATVKSARGKRAKG